jgi:hypothetical protein
VDGQFPPAARVSEEGTRYPVLASFTGLSFTTLQRRRHHNIATRCCQRHPKIFATSRQALCRSIRALEMAAFKGKPFRETNEGYLKQRSCPQS